MNGCIFLKVNPAYTSQECRECHHVTADNRPTRDVFRCVACGHGECADANASANILARGLAMLAAA